MKMKKLLLPMIILLVAVVAMVAYAVFTNIAQVPTTMEHSFPFSITYELDGKTQTIDAVYEACFEKHDGYVGATTRYYAGRIVGKEVEDDPGYLLSQTDEGTIYLYTNFYPDYLMGDPLYEYFDHSDYAPELLYYDLDGMSYSDEQTLAAHGAKLISWEYPDPIENSFTFSHIACMSSEVVFPMLGIGILALLAVIIFVRRDKDLEKTKLDRSSTIFNFIIGLTVVPFMALYGAVSDINGTSADFLHQLGYIIPAITLLGLTASVALRRKGFCKSGFAVQFVGPAIFGVLIICLLFVEQIL